MSPGTTTRGEQAPTRQRLIDAAIPLFAAQGYEGTSVGEIEAAAGLVPRSGALYKHFDSKRALLGAALAERMDAIDAIDEQLELLPVGELRAELELVARLALGELDQERDLARIVMKESDRFPEIARDFHDAVVARGRAVAINWLRIRSRELGIELGDTEAMGEVLSDAIIGRGLKSFMFGDRLGVVETDRHIAAWVEVAAAALGEGGPTTTKKRRNG